MQKELTIIVVFLLGLAADGIWFKLDQTFGFNFFVQISFALFLLIFIFLSGKKYLTKRFYPHRKLLSVSVWKYFRSGFQLDFWKRQTPLPRV